MIRLLFASIGSEGYARRVTNASFCTYMICLRCQNVFSTLSLTPAQIKSAHFYTLILVLKRRIVLGMIEVFAGMDRIVGTNILRELCA